MVRAVTHLVSVEAVTRVEVVFVVSPLEPLMRSSSLRAFHPISFVLQLGIVCVGIRCAAHCDLDTT
jgi:hypothetical protein